jgi:hypothetical protein
MVGFGTLEPVIVVASRSFETGRETRSGWFR